MLSLLSLLLVGQAAAGLLGSASGISTRTNDPDEIMRRYVDSIISDSQFKSTLARRQAPAAPPDLDTTKWNVQTAALCADQLARLGGVASNPSGMAVCYNLPALDNSTGVFMADLRVFMISPPTGEFTSISSANVQVGLLYTGATVSPLNAAGVVKRGAEIANSISWPQDVVVEKRAVAIPTMVQQYMFVGQVNQDLLATNMGTAALQKVLVPTVSLAAQNATGQPVTVVLSSSEATFVNGVFSKVFSPTKSRVIPPLQTLVVAPDAPFVVPGLTFGLFPVGLVVTGTWTLLFISTIVYGTIGRMRFRDQYRRRLTMAKKATLSRI